MSNLVFHPTTKLSVDQFIASPVHAVALTGPQGSGKGSVAQYIAQQLLGLNLAAFERYAYKQTLQPEKSQSITIDQIRELQRFMTLKIPGSSSTSRIAIIEKAHLLTLEAQNALLKLLEEPPEGTVLILTVSSNDGLIPTIQSRLRYLHVMPPKLDDIKRYLEAQGAHPAEIERALAISGSLPGLTQTLLGADQTHPIFEATDYARRVLQSKVFERLTMVDSLSKQKQLCTDMLYVMQHMARAALLKQPEAKAQERWRHIIHAAYEASERLERNAQTKLVLTNLMLEL